MQYIDKFIIGAHHSARFMAYGIYTLKLEMLSSQLDLSQDDITSIHRMAIFVALFYAEQFLKSRLASISPAQDLKYLHYIQLYRVLDDKGAEVVTQSLKNHLWYLTAELVIFSLFDSELPDTVRKNIVFKLLSFTRPKHFAHGKPKFPSIDTDSPIDYPDQLVSFVGPRFWLLFHLLKMDGAALDWMKAPVKYWQRMVGYQKIEEIVRSLEVVNDCAERGIKLISDFKDVCRDIDEQQDLCLVIQDYRDNLISLKKSDLNNSSVPLNSFCSKSSKNRFFTRFFWVKFNFSVKIFAPFIFS